MKFTELNGCSLSMGSLYMPVVELEEEDHNVDAKLQDVKFKSINLLKVRDHSVTAIQLTVCCGRLPCAAARARNTLGTRTAARRR